MGLASVRSWRRKTRLLATGFDGPGGYGGLDGPGVSDRFWIRKEGLVDGGRMKRGS